MDDLIPASLQGAFAERPWLWVLVVGAVLVALRLLSRAGRSTHPVSTSKRPGEVWFAEVPFRDGSGAKDRPVVVLSTRGRTVTVAELTSQDKSAYRDHVRVPDGLPGLHRTSWVDLQPVDLPVRSFRRRVGDAGPAWVFWFREQAAARGY